MTPAENHLSPICSDQPVLSGSNSQRQAQWALRLGDAAVKGAVAAAGDRVALAS